MEDKHTPRYLLLQKDPEILIHNSDLLNLIPYELDLTSTPFFDTTTITYEIELPPSGNKIGFNLLNYEEVTISYVTDTIPNSPVDRQVPAQANNNVYIVDNNREEPITSQGALDELNIHKTPCGKSQVNISLRRRKRYHRTDLEAICSIFDQIRPVVSHLEFYIPETTLTPKNIGAALKSSLRQFWKQALFVQYDKNKNASLLSLPIPIKSLSEGKNILCSLIAPSIQ